MLRGEVQATNQNMLQALRKNNNTTRLSQQRLRSRKYTEDKKKMLVEQILELKEVSMANEVFLKQYADKSKPKELWKAWTKGQRGRAK